MKNIKKLIADLLIATLLAITMISDASAVLKVKSNAAGKLYIAKPTGEPLMWHTDTGWGLCRLISQKSDGSYDIEKAKTYIAQRKVQGFNIVMGVIRHCIYGQTLDQADLFPYPGDDHALNGFVQIMEYAKSNNMYVGVLPVWGSDITGRNQEGAYVMTEAEAFAWGKKVGEKLRAYNDHIIWIIGGDSRPYGNGNPLNKDYRPLFREMAEGIALGVTNTTAEIKYNNNDPRWENVFMTYHPNRGWSSSDDFASDYWIDFHGFETSPQEKIPKERRAYGMTKHHWDNFRSKPVVSLEDVYFNNNAFYNNVNLHHSGYQTMLAGAAGYSFGWWDIWNFDKAKWLNTLYHDDDIKFTKTFKQIMSRIQWHQLEPDQNIIVAGAGELYSQEQKIAAKKVGKRIVVYYPQRNEATIDVSALNMASGGQAKVTWINTLANYTESNISTPSVPSDKKLTLTPPSGFTNAILIVEPNSLTTTPQILAVEKNGSTVRVKFRNSKHPQKPEGGYTLTIDGSRFDMNGNVTASAPYTWTYTGEDIVRSGYIFSDKETVDVTYSNVASLSSSCFGILARWSASMGGYKSSVCTISSTPQAAFSVEVYPVPTTGIVHILHEGTAEQAQLMLLNDKGEIVLSQAFSKQPIEQLNLSAMKKGLYYLKVINKEAVLVKRIVLE